MKPDFSSDHTDTRLMVELFLTLGRRDEALALADRNRLAATSKPETRKAA